MEEHLADAATADLLVKIGWHLASAFVALVVGVISALLWGRGGRKRLVKSNAELNERVAALEAQNRMPAITQIVNVPSSSPEGERERHLRTAINAATVTGLNETIRRLPQKPLSDGHTYATLPDRTNIVSMADGSYRLALPIELKAEFHGELDGSFNATLELKKRPPAASDDERTSD